jgi:hypothetical protein
VNRRHQRQRSATETGAMIGTVLQACLLAGLLASTVGVVALLRTVQLGPPVGEILRFGPYGQPAPIWQIQAIRSSDHRRCVLKPAVMATVDGSMVVERRLAGSGFQAHWAGGPTSDGDGNCGSAADLTLGLVEMQTLVNADGAGRHWYFAGF